MYVTLALYCCQLAPSNIGIKKRWNYLVVKRAGMEMASQRNDEPQMSMPCTQSSNAWALQAATQVQSYVCSFSQFAYSQFGPLLKASQCAFSQKNTVSEQVRFIRSASYRASATHYSALCLIHSLNRGSQTTENFQRATLERESDRRSSRSSIAADMQGGLAQEATVG